MSFTSWLPECLRRSSRPASRRKASASQPPFRPMLEALEERRVPSTLTVTNNLDSGAGSLRAEIALAHNGDTIVFASSLNGQTITLSSGELLINKNLTIQGPGAGELTISGDRTPPPPFSPSRVFEIARTTSKNVTLSGLTISHGSATGSTTGTIQGGGIYNHGALTVSNCTLSDNTASNGGGGISNDVGATLTVSGCNLSNNSPGGIANSGTLSVSGSTLSGNFAKFGSGGGIWNNGTATVTDTTVSGNSAKLGGGIYNFSGLPGSLTLDGVSLYGNSAQYGGAIYDASGKVTLSSSAVTGNSATQQGGGIYVSGGTGAYACTVTVKNSSSITGNTPSAGVGDDVYNLGTLYLDGTSIIGVLDGNAATNPI